MPALKTNRARANCAAIGGSCPFLADDLQQEIELSSQRCFACGQWQGAQTIARYRFTGGTGECRRPGLGELCSSSLGGGGGAGGGGGGGAVPSQVS